MDGFERQIAGGYDLQTGSQTNRQSLKTRLSLKNEGINYSRRSHVFRDFEFVFRQRIFPIQNVVPQSSGTSFFCTSTSCPSKSHLDQTDKGIFGKDVFVYSVHFKVSKVFRFANGTFLRKTVSMKFGQFFWIQSGPSMQSIHILTHDVIHSSNIHQTQQSLKRRIPIQRLEFKLDASNSVLQNKTALKVLEVLFLSFAMSRRLADLSKPISTKTLQKSLTENPESRTMSKFRLL